MTFETRPTLGVTGTNVTLTTADAKTGAPIQTLTFTPEQARYYARMLWAQADIAEGKLPEVPK